MTGTPIAMVNNTEEAGTNSAVDLERIANAVREILSAVGEDPEREGLLDTPYRVARAYKEAFAGLQRDPAEALGAVFNEDYRDFVLVRNIDVASFCEHHLLPFKGTAHIGYIPGNTGAVVGLSKLSRLVDIFARRPQVQERLTSQIADALCDFLDANGVIVRLECEHTCMSNRGVKQATATTVTSALRGSLRHDTAKQAYAFSAMQTSR